MAIPLPLKFFSTIHTPLRTIPKSSHRLNPKISIPCSKLYLTRAIEENRQSETTEAEPEVPEMRKEIQKAVEEKSAYDLLSGVLEEVRAIEWPPFQKVLGTTGVVLGVIAGSSVVLLTVNAVLAELSDKVFAGRGIQDFFS